MPRPGKKQLNVFVSEESFQAWRRFADAQGVSVTALIEAVGLELASVERPSPTLRSIVARARQVDTERRRKL